MLTELKRLLGIMSGDKMNSETREDLVREALLMILSRATIADSNISGVEVSKVREILKAKTGEDVSEQDIRVTAISQHYESHSFDAFVARLGDVLEKEDRVMLSSALADVIRADAKTSPFEAEFFNKVVADLKLEASDIALG